MLVIVSVIIVGTFAAYQVFIGHSGWRTKQLPHHVPEPSQDMQPRHRSRRPPLRTTWWYTPDGREFNLPAHRQR